MNDTVEQPAGMVNVVGVAEVNVRDPWAAQPLADAIGAAAAVTTAGSAQATPTVSARRRGWVETRSAAEEAGAIEVLHGQARESERTPPAPTQYRAG